MNSTPQYFSLELNLGAERVMATDVARIACRVRRLALIGPAGAGKSISLQRSLEALPASIQVMKIELRRWDARLEERLMQIQPSQANLLDGLDVLLEAANEDVTANRLAEFSERGPVLLAVDGINEVRGEVAVRIVYILDCAIRRWPNVAVLATDRLAARYEMNGKWIRANMLALSDSVVQEILDRHLGQGTWSQLDEHSRRLLSVPFFLDLARRNTAATGHMRSGAIARFVAEQAQVSMTSVEEIVTATLEAYRSRQRWISRRSIGREAFDELAEIGVLLIGAPASERVDFAHQLYGDYFASRAILRNADAWNNITLDEVTFDAETFDPVTLAAEQLSNPVVGDNYIRAVYDWNWRAAVACVLATDPNGPAFSRASRLIVLSLLSERRSDPVAGTRLRANSLLSQFTDADGQFLAGLPPEKVPGALRDIRDLGPSFTRWQNIFCSAADSIWTSEQIGQICDRDPLHGWTVSYTLKRNTLSERVGLLLCGMYWAARVSEGSDAVHASSIRWRVVHTLGAWPATDALAVLLSAIDDDPHVWVRWGAARSVVEIAARSPDEELSARAMTALADRVGVVSDKLAAEIAWVAQYHGAMPYFEGLAGPVLYAFYAHQATELSAVRWAQYVDRFETFWRDQRRMNATNGGAG